MRQSLPFAIIVMLLAGPGSLLESRHASAQTEIYRVERNGKIEYSSKPHSPEATPAELPKLGRWNLETPSAVRNSCASHGGINCALGADSDGSVICFDSYRESIQRFAAECTAAKLEIIDLSAPDTRGAFRVTVRNNRSVAAKKAVVQYKPRRMEAGVALTGPDEVEGFGVGEFQYNPKTPGKPAGPPKPTQFIISCDNCG